MEHVPVCFIFCPQNMGNLIPTPTKYGIPESGHRQVKILTIIYPVTIIVNI